MIIENQVTDFMHWLGNRELVPTIRALRDTAERARRHEMERALRRLAKGEDPQVVLEQLSHALTDKLLHRADACALACARRRPRAAGAVLTRLYQIPRPE